MSGASTFSPIPETPEGFLTIVKHNGYSLTDHQGNRNSMAASQLLNKTAWADFATGEGAEFAIGAPTLEMWCASWNAVLDKKGAEETDFKKIEADGENTATAEYGYYLKSPDTGVSKQDGIYMNGTTDGLSEELLTKLESSYGVFWSHASPLESKKVTANGVTGDCWGYWLASPITLTSMDEDEQKDTGLGFVYVSGKVDAYNAGNAYNLGPYGRYSSSSMSEA